MKVAVIGTGISGNLVARLLSNSTDLHVFEANDYVGGHSRTVDFDAFDGHWKADIGFMVFNERTYPNFCRMLEILGTPSQASDMSFSVRCQPADLEYQGSSLNGLFAQRRNLLRPQFFRMLLDIAKFNRRSITAIETGSLDAGLTVGEFLQQCGTSEWFRQNYFIPMVAAIWSAQPETVAAFPARFLIGFMRNHGLLQIKDRPQWRTIPNGSRHYVDALVAPFRDRVRLNSPVSSVRRSDHEVVLTTPDSGSEAFDQVVFATHADQTLAILDDASPAEREILAAFPYQPNEGVLHTDTRLLPRRRSAWASWNYHIEDDADGIATVTYDLSRLQGIDSPEPILFTLNRTDSIRPETVIGRYQFEHPAYSLASVAAQERFHEINGARRTHFCGAYWGYGFHEDGVNSALAVAEYFGESLDECKAVSTRDESLTAAMIP